MGSCRDSTQLTAMSGASRRVTRPFQGRACSSGGSARLSSCRNKLSCAQFGALLLACWWAGMQFCEARPAGASAPFSQAGTSNAAAVLELHNQYRAKHGAAPLVWSHELAAAAAQHAHKCIWRHSTLQEQNRNIENLYFSRGIDRHTIESRATKAWYDEIHGYTRNGPRTAKHQGAMTGYVSQAMWLKTRAVGCTYVRCPSLIGTPFGKDVDYFVCQYDMSGKSGQAYHKNAVPADSTPMATTATTHPTKAATAKQQPNPSWANSPPDSREPVDGVKGSQGWLQGYKHGHKGQPSLAVPSWQLRKMLSIMDWDGTPACQGVDSSCTTKDSSGRLWGFENGVTCAYKEISWSTAATCLGSDSGDSVADSYGRLWRCENGKSCAYKSTNTASNSGQLVSSPAAAPTSSPAEQPTSSQTAQPTTAPAAQPATSASGQPTTVSWDAAPPCAAPENGQVLKDSDGKVWGYENGVSCAYRSTSPATVHNGPPATSATAPAVTGPGGQPPSIPWDTAPPCQLTDSSSGTRDTQGKLWGFENGVSCAYKSSSVASGAGQPTLIWDTAPACKGQVTNPVKDGLGHLWGFEGKQSCAVKSSSATESAQPQTGQDWDATPECQGKVPTGVTDSMGRVWGFEKGKTCAFKAFSAQTAGPTTAQQGSALQAPEQPGTGGADPYDTAPACKGGGTIKDKQGRLWGFEDGKSCAVKSSGTTATASSPTAAQSAVTHADDGTSNIVVASAPVIPRESAAASVELWVNGWDIAPACEGKPGQGDMKDSMGRWWGFQNGATCAYKGR